jgi:glycosyltransferase involved in cell wall biosynthesis
MKKRKISVCMATYNGEKFITEQIISIQTQLSYFDELIISDDASTDSTLCIVKKISDARIKIVINERDKGYSGNFENAISHATGDIIFLSDQDDVWLPDRVAKMMDILLTADMVVCDAKFVDENLNDLQMSLFRLRNIKKGFMSNLYKSRYLGACIAFRKEMLDKLLPFPKNKSLCPHDLWISLIGELYFKVKLLNEPLILYRRHGKNASGGGIKSSNGIVKKILFRLYVLIMVLLRSFKK